MTLVRNKVASLFTVVRLYDRAKVVRDVVTKLGLNFGYRLRAHGIAWEPDPTGIWNNKKSRAPDTRDTKSHMNKYR